MEEDSYIVAPVMLVAFLKTDDRSLMCTPYPVSEEDMRMILNNVGDNKLKNGILALLRTEARWAMKEDQFLKNGN